MPPTYIGLSIPVFALFMCDICRYPHLGDLWMLVMKDRVSCHMVGHTRHNLFWRLISYRLHHWMFSVVTCVVVKALQITYIDIKPVHPWFTRQNPTRYIQTETVTHPFQMVTWPQVSDCSTFRKKKWYVWWISAWRVFLVNGLKNN